MFLKFRDEDGIFEAEDARDLLSLYNAAHLTTHGEGILDEAISFTKRQLRSLMPKVVEGSLAHDINSALEIPLPRRVRIYEAKYFMSTYEKGASVNEMIMELAKLSYNIMQIHHQQELKIITRLSNLFLLKLCSILINVKNVFYMCVQVVEGSAT